MVIGEVAPCVVGLSDDVSFGFIHKNFGSLLPPPIVSMQGEMPFGKYILPYCGLLNLLSCTRLAICITLFIANNYYRLFPESSEDVPRRYFVAVRGKTTINAVRANLSRWGGGKDVARTHYAGVVPNRAAYALT